MRKRVLAYLGGTVILLIAGKGFADSSRLTVQVRNLSRADGEMLSQAEAIARRIFQDAGVETEWGAPADPHNPDPSMPIVQIFATRSKRLDLKDAFGAALTARKESESFLANVFFGNIEEAATTRGDAAILLGHVMAHEVGHLLLGAAHVPGTIMAESLGSRDIPLMQAGRVRFNQRQAERLRVAVTLRQRRRQATK